MYERILLVVEANRTRHAAMDRAVATLALHRSEVQIRVLVLINADTSDTTAENPAMYRGRRWFDDLTKPLELVRVDHDLVVSWSSHFAAAILYAARQFKATLIGVPVDDGVTDGELAMLRDPPCPVFFTRPGGSPVKRQCILVALRPEPGEDDSVIVNSPLVMMAQRAAELHQAQLHVVYSPRSGEDCATERMAQATGVPVERVHRVEGPPEEAIRRAVADLDADLLALGSRQRQATQSLRGGIIDRLVGELSIDVLVVA